MIVGVIGILLAIAFFVVVSGKIAWSKVSTLRITWPTAKPLDPSLLDIPLPTVATVGVICALLIAGAVFVMVRQPTRAFSIYTGLLIFSSIFMLLIWAGAGSRIDMVDVLARTVRLA